MNEREIKFRAWNDEKKKMWRFAVPLLDQACNGNKINVSDHETGGFNDFVAGELQQFTGLKDANGMEIYEGDLIRQTNFNGEEYEAIYLVVFDAPTFCLKMIKGNEKAMSISGLCSFQIRPDDNNKLRKGEVAGNIFEHPHLLNQQLESK